MSKKNKIIVIFAIIAIIVMIFISEKNKSENNQKLVNSENEIVEENEIEEQEEVEVKVTGKAVEDKTTNEYKISNIKMTAKQSKTEVILTVKNISSKDTKERDVYIKYLDNQNNEIGKTKFYLPKMEKDKEITLSTIIMKDLRNAVNYKIEY